MKIEKFDDILAEDNLVSVRIYQADKVYTFAEYILADGTTLRDGNIKNYQSEDFEKLSEEEQESVWEFLDQLAKEALEAYKQVFTECFYMLWDEEFLERDTVADNPNPWGCPWNFTRQWEILLSLNSREAGAKWFKDNKEELSYLQPGGSRVPRKRKP